MLLIDPIGNNSGYWTWNTEGSMLLVWGVIPFEIYVEYFLGMLFIMLPIRWRETFNATPNSIPFRLKYSYPLYFGWSLFAATTYWAFRKGIDNVGCWGVLFLFLLTVGLWKQRKKLKLIY